MVNFEYLPKNTMLCMEYEIQNIFYCCQVGSNN